MANRIAPKHPVLLIMLLFWNTLVRDGIGIGIVAGGFAKN
jgi:hypothetical protein